MPGQVVDGNDVLEVYRQTQELIASCRKGRGTGPDEGQDLSDPWPRRVMTISIMFDKKELGEWIRRSPIQKLEGKTAGRWNDGKEGNGGHLN